LCVIAGDGSGKGKRDKKNTVGPWRVCKRDKNTDVLAMPNKIKLLFFIFYFSVATHGHSTSIYNDCVTIGIIHVCIYRSYTQSNTLLNLSHFSKESRRVRLRLQNSNYGRGNGLVKMSAI
jgi:hypothetical protein